ncbi:MAG: 1-phosphofructokinase [Oscillospiraceae bacterium]|nr:1-phosphofructokinase [Oscillospiraceae bacterium]
MIYTVTFNPALDLVVCADTIRAGGINKLRDEKIFPGGKGINVSLVLAQLGIRSKALGFAAGFTGEEIIRRLSEAGIETDFVRLKSGFSRINMKLRADEETEFNGLGPDIGADELSELFRKLDELKDNDTLVLAGSIPSSLPSDIYEKILAQLSGRNIRTVVDASNDLLLNVLKYRPFLVKPNNIELGDMFGTVLETTGQIAEHAEKLRQMGARNVLVSMAGDGALLIDENGTLHRCGVCRGEVKNSVGAGDSMVAGFIAGCEKDFDYALKLGTACGGATAFSEGLAEKSDIDRLLAELI